MIVDRSLILNIVNHKRKDSNLLLAKYNPVLPNIKDTNETY